MPTAKKTPPTSPKKVPFHRRFPGEWTTQTTLWTPEKLRIQVQSVVSTEVGELILALLTARKRVNEPKIVRLTKSLAKVLTEDRKG